MKIFISLTMAISLSVSGCSVFVPKTQTVRAACSEADATLQINGGQTYTGQASLEARRGRIFSYSCLKPGYYPAHKTVSYSMSTTGIADFIGSMIFIIPVIGIFSPGAWDLDETDVTINMVRY